MSTKVTELVAAQTDLGGRISRFLSNLRKSGAEYLTRPNLLRRRELLESYWRLFTERHAEITRQAEPTLPYLFTDLFSEVEEAYIEHGSAIDEMLEAKPAPPTPVPVNTMPAESEVVLPPMKLPSFSGDLYQWESFRDQFCSLVHESTRIPKVRKMQYLKSCLTGEAAKMLDLTPITEANYDGAWTALERRFGNQRILTAAHMRRLITYPTLAKAQPSEIKRLLDEFRQTQRAFQALRKPVAEWDEWLVFLASEKLDHTTRLAWEMSLRDPTATPCFDDLESYLENRVHALGSARPQDPPAPVPKGGGAVIRPIPSSARNMLAVKVETKPKPKGGRLCPLCSGSHALSACKTYKALSAAERRQFVQKKGLCLNCLASSHQQTQCSSEYRCWACDGTHHTTLHDSFQRGQPNEATTSSTSAAYAVSTNRVTLLATARVSLEATNGRTLTVRALLDSGSESSFLSEWAAQSLRLKRRAVRVELTGYQGANVGTARSEVQVTLRSPLDRTFQVAVDALVTKRLIAPTPAQRVLPGDWPHVQGLPLADPHYSEPAQVDVLLGADVCGMLLLEKRSGPAGTPVAVRTPFGWTLLGPVEQPAAARSTRILHVSRQASLPDLQLFWELEEVAPSSPMSPEDLQCEELFSQSTRRDPTGRYVVRLPFRGEERPKVASSRAVALRMLLNAERNRSRDQSLREQYVGFMEEYHRLGHMERARESLMNHEPGCYLTHHAVWKVSDGRKKIRVVFNASLGMGSGGSLNDSLLAGPKLQSDLWAVITRWRLHKVAFSADIVKMFRQILVHPEDQDWLRILWRNDPGEAVTDFRLSTVTYGTAPAPYLANRVLKQLAVDGESRFPLGARAVREHSYVDDILTGADDLQRALEIRRQLTDLLSSAGFQLDKWASNVPELRAACVEEKVFQDKEVHGALGLCWDVRGDTLAVRGPLFSDAAASKWTKRTVLSEIARLFDPLGWLAPVIVRAKTILQDLWLAGVSWDEPLDASMAARWSQLRIEISSLTVVTVPRWVGFSPCMSDVELHGFSDASERAYVAVVYLVVRRKTGSWSNLLMGKTRVAPIKPQTIPRLELCGAVLLARLLSSLRSALNFDEVTTHAWSDSTVTLAWIRTHPSKWKTFVAHRVAEIQNLLPGVTWRHVGTLDNPADLATRGISAEELRASPLWWHGPSWLTAAPGEWPATTTLSPCEVAPEQRSVAVAQVVVAPEENSLVLRFSSLSRLTRVSAYLRRFIHNTRRPAVKKTGPLSVTELKEALTCVVRVTQRCTQRRGPESRRAPTAVIVAGVTAAPSPHREVDPPGDVDRTGCTPEDSAREPLYDSGLGPQGLLDTQVATKGEAGPT
ncbi:uncharacterized protein LOC143364357 [Halictus rubicundus]|uniref:uncharacterized protein LOC143364357 n=1 Tax=Halictus rubicundus TaxID=77578 RepID=UPI00403529A3